MGKKNIGKKFVYVVDDCPAYRSLLKLALEREGYRVRLFENGAYALKALNRYESIISYPALILSDLRMPMVNGLELYDEVKRSPLTKNIPFLFMSAGKEKPLIAAAEERSEQPVFNKLTRLNLLPKVVNEVLLEQNCLVDG
ncbi:MAG: response regulator [Cyanothece sp. SIO1E1]|nr:response regulator [Cyanothece sp. SIO1E1]